MKFCVIGAGSGGRAIAAYLSSKNYSVNLYNRSHSRIKYIKKKGGIKAQGILDGFFPLDKITNNLEEAVKDVDFIMIAIPASAHKEIAKKMAPYLSNNQYILLNPGRTFGAIVLKKEIEILQPNLRLFIAEAQTLLFTSRALKRNRVKILRIKDTVKFSGYREVLNSMIHYKIKDIFPNLKPVNDYFQLTLNNIGMLLHPTISLLNSGAIESGLQFKFYKEGASNRNCMILEQLQFEINKILMKLGLRRFSFCRWAYEVYNVSEKTIYDTLQKIEVYQEINSPTELKTRYFTEDVPTGLVPLASLGKFLNIDTPTIDSIIHLSSILCNCDFWKHGRTIESLELESIIEHRFNLEPSIEEPIKERKEYLFT
ncbi:MAG: NADP transhydrogenase subunit alpha [Candidatus Lokiarchaeota archaeon]|nr:NADP transhydrogenase subunit alpha [Candidatus Lokiarchaeota archaeon]MBD3202458.1 NADP transhydrogenase subunit alpha [Candidatus Lokiarchaeota archaeon]